MLRQLRMWADLLDSRFRIPGTEIRFGIDPILSFIPGLGELASPAFAALLLVQGVRQRVPKIVLIRMVANALFDAILGAIPVAGNIADVFWRANTVNLALLERHARPGRPPSTGDYVFIWAMAAVLGILVAVPVIVSLLMMGWLWSLMR